MILQLVALCRCIMMTKGELCVADTRNFEHEIAHTMVMEHHVMSFYISVISFEPLTNYFKIIVILYVIQCSHLKPAVSSVTCCFCLTS